MANSTLNLMTKRMISIDSAGSQLEMISVNSAGSKLEVKREHTPGTGICIMETGLQILKEKR